MPSQINKIVRVDLPIVADAGKALKEMVAFLEDAKHKADGPRLQHWWKTIDRWRGKKSLAYQEFARP